MTILWDNEPGASDRYHFALGHVQLLGSAPLVHRALDDDAQSDLVVIGPMVNLDEASLLVESVRGVRPEVGFILLRHRLDVTTMTQALRSGFREVVASDDAPALSDAVRRSRDLTARLAGHQSGGPAAQGRIITVFSAKGGVGKTTLSTNIATHLALSNQRTVLVDLDLSFGDVGISMQLMPSNSVHDAVSMSGSLDGEGLAQLVTHHEASGLDVIAAPTDPSLADRVSAQVVSELLRVAAAHYDYVIVDTPPSFTEHVLAACDVSSLLVLIATLDIPAVKNLKLALETLDALGSPKESRVIVLNRADVKVGLRDEDVVQAIGAPIAVSIPASITVPASVNRGVPLVLESPRDPVSVALREIADKHIRGRFGTPVEDTQRRSLFSRRSR
ncbi:response regulator [Knoellia locipacati]|uniref:Transcriptional regulator n=1 Tax=Knoellia locipacati TaxID=882824 RepID=A0A512SWF2_9MICO|nr:AAA family ATPase [Knoellia locipacati]GEQ12254.1 transcriptional regulator [Knoellia locipacati]